MGERHKPQTVSEEQLKAFLEAVKADARLQEKLKSAADADAVVATANAEGFVISAEELKNAQSEISEEELSDEELEEVTGGTHNEIMSKRKRQGQCI